MFINSLLALAALASTSFATPIKREDVKVLAGAPINSLNLTITPDSPVEGGNVTLDWGYGDAGTAPYNVQIGTGGYYANLTWLYEFTNITGTNLTWNVNVTAGETLVFQLWDATNTTTYTQNHKVLPNNATATTTTDNSTTTSVVDSTTSPSSTSADDEEEESFLGELLADIQSELDG
ncbi:hypothetical protein I302_104966 [Kwoniella bestiolae CBS 10118]|uniref:Uncharacterized protein n=1 Tax=Kwoniella bestiolae CBS 10118 TaxID=1296100 RepID=A0A1B9FR87_9TREE|nr:hypothetical protein I302_08963 [Kwoniella bestiolae CBS 10118]OCF21290.1 hypothetical protein I302_08963 [Kwoniella bestiolae CBS 10118]